MRWNCGYQSALGQCGITSMIFTYSFSILSRILGIGDQGVLTYVWDSRFQSIEKAFVLTDLGSGCLE